MLTIKKVEVRLSTGQDNEEMTRSYVTDDNGYWHRDETVEGLLTGQAVHDGLDYALDEISFHVQIEETMA